MAVDNGTVYLGRSKLYTDYVPDSMADKDNTKIISKETLPTILQQVWQTHYRNTNEITYLLNYYKGEQDILKRKKFVRPDIDNRVVFNHAMAITRDIVGYTFGKPVCYVQRKDSDKTNVKELTNLVEAEDKFTSDQELAEYASICGTAFRGIFADIRGVEDDVPFSIVTLDPRNTFVVYSSQIGNPPVLACTYYEVEPIGTNLGEYVYIFYTTDKIYKCKSCGGSLGIITDGSKIEEQDNPMGLIPIVEYRNNTWGMGDWEMAVNLLNAINLVGSDCVNDIEGVVNSILVGINLDLSESTQEKFKANNIISFPSMKENPSDLKYIYNQADATSLENLRSYLLNELSVIVGMPTANSESYSGGDTGDAVYLRNGYERLEVIARMKETFFKRSERNSLRLILKIMEIKNEPLNLTPKDITIKFSRSMTDNLISKASALSTLVSTKVLTPEDALTLVGLTTEPAEMAKKGKEYWEANTDVTEDKTTETDTKVSTKDAKLKQKVDR